MSNTLKKLWNDEMGLILSVRRRSIEPSLTAY